MRGFPLPRRQSQGGIIDIVNAKVGPRAQRYAAQRDRFVTRMLAIGAIAGLVSTGAFAEQALRVAVQENSAPKFITQSLGGAVQGICPDLLRALEQQDPTLRFTFEPSVHPLRRIEVRMEMADADANCLVDNTERRIKFHVLPTQLFSLDYHLIARANDPVHISDWEDVRRLGDEGRILIVSGTGVMNRLRKVGRLSVREGGKSATANLKMLVLGRGRFFYYRTNDWDRQVRAAKVEGQVRILPARLEAVQFHLMFGRHVEYAVVARAERALDALQANGTLALLRAKWGLR